MKSLKGKLTLIVVLTLLALALVISCVFYIQLKINLGKGIEDVLGSTAKGQAGFVQEWVKGRYAFINAAQKIYSDEAPQPILERLSEAGGFTRAYIGYSDKGMKYSEVGRVKPNGYDPTARPW